MDISICHYSFHRTWKEENWDTDRLCDEVAELGVKGVDFHAGLLGEPDKADERICDAIENSGLTLTGLSLSTNFLLDDPKELKEMVAKTRRWIEVSSEVEAPVSRIFGGSLKDRTDPDARAAAMYRIIDPLSELADYAEGLGVILALENHGGLPCTGEEQKAVINKINSPALRATVDVGNYMACGQEGIEGTKIAAPLCAYVHLKDMKKTPDDSTPWGWKPSAAILGKGDVDLPACIEEIARSGYDGWLAIEYEAPDDERKGIKESVEYIRSILK